MTGFKKALQKCLKRYANADFKMPLYVCVLTKTIFCKFCILKTTNSRVICS